MPPWPTSSRISYFSSRRSAMTWSSYPHCNHPSLPGIQAKRQALGYDNKARDLGDSAPPGKANMRARLRCIVAIGGVDVHARGKKSHVVAQPRGREAALDERTAAADALAREGL